MIRSGENSDSIPNDLVMEILSRLPAKSIGRFRCVSKQWDSMLLSPYFTDLFLTRSSARLLCVVNPFDEDWCLLSSPLPENPYEKSSLVVAPDLHMKFPEHNGMLYVCGHASGFICFNRITCISEEGHRRVHLVCNPTTGQLASLPLHKGTGFLGFDPVDKQYKVLSISARYDDNNEKQEPCKILTIGTGNDSWREIHCPLSHFPSGQGEICINGVLYYFHAGKHYALEKIVCFDVRSEKFKFIDIDFFSYHATYKLINYKGKLGVSTLMQSYSPKSIIEVCMWVIKDVHKPEPEWSKHSYDQVVDDCFRYPALTVVGVTATDDVVLSRVCWNKEEPFYIYYLSPGRNTLHSVEIKGFGANHFQDRIKGHNPGVDVFLDHVEDLRFLMMKSSTDAATSRRRPARKRYPKRTSTTSAKAHVQQDVSMFESINKFDSLRLLDDDECT